MRRREFIAGLSSAAAWPTVAGAQRAAVPVVAVLIGGDLTPEQRAAFARGLAETGYVEGRNVAVEYHDRGGDVEGVLRKLADGLARQRVAVIATPGSSVAAFAAKAVTATVPIVFGIGSDPVEGGLVESFSHPGANVTGYTEMQADVVSKRLGLLHTLAPNSARFGVLIDPHCPSSEFLRQRAA
jgi:putative tryptophan/tyrosine transport system substrate-binding protein